MKPIKEDLANLRKQVSEINLKYPHLTRDEAFVMWYLRNLTDSDEKSLDSILGAPYDKGVDAIFFEYDLSIIYLIQAKYREGSTGHEGRSDILALANLGETLLGNDENRFNRLVEKPTDPLVSESLIKARKLLRKKYKLSLHYITTGNVSDNHIHEAESFIEKFSDSVSFEVYGKKEISRLVEDYEAGVAPPIPSIDIPVQKGELFNRYDYQKGISAWIFTIKGDQLGKLFKNIGVRIFARNIRGFLGNTKINRGMENTIRTEPEFFWYFNNGVTIICDDAKEIKIREGYSSLRVKNAQIINGQQTVRVLAKHPDSRTSVIGKIIVVPRDSPDEAGRYRHLVDQIVSASNWQNAISQSDLKSNDEEQIKVERQLRQLNYQYLRKKQTKSESKRAIRKQTLTPIKKEDLAKYVAACIIGPYEVRLGKNRLFEDDLYSRIFNGRDAKEYLFFYWLHRIIHSITRTQRRYGFAKWLVLNFLWSQLGSKFKNPHIRDNFVHVAERQRNFHSVVKMLITIVKIILNTAMSVYRLNRITKDTVMTETDFFREKDLPDIFKKYWKSSSNPRRDDFNQHSKLFIKYLQTVER